MTLLGIDFASFQTISRLSQVAQLLKRRESLYVGAEDKAKTFFFFSWTSIQFLKIQLQKIFYTLDELIEME